MYPFTREKLHSRVPQIIAAAVRDARPLDGITTIAAPGSVRPLRDGARARGGCRLARANARPAVGRCARGSERCAAGQYRLGHPRERRQHPLAARLVSGAGRMARPPGAAGDRLGRRRPGQPGGDPVPRRCSACRCRRVSSRRFCCPPRRTRASTRCCCACMCPSRGPFGGLRLLLRDEHVWRLGITMRALLEAAETYRESDTAGHRLSAAVNDAYNLLDLRSGWRSDAFAASARAALELLDRTIAELPPADGPVLLSTGHAHLDTAWLWPLWRTRQKVAHTVATALHLMERYPDYHFSHVAAAGVRLPEAGRARAVRAASSSRRRGPLRADRHDVDRDRLQHAERRVAGAPAGARRALLRGAVRLGAAQRLAARCLRLQRRAAPDHAPVRHAAVHDHQDQLEPVQPHAARHLPLARHRRLAKC